MITPTGAASVKLKGQNGAVGRRKCGRGGENEGGIIKKKITLRDGSTGLECITPTQTFSSEQEEELNDWIKR